MTEATRYKNFCKMIEKWEAMKAMNKKGSDNVKVLMKKFKDKL